MPEEKECSRGKHINPDPRFKMCPECRAYGKFQNRRSRAKRRKERAIANEEPPQEILKAPDPYKELPGPGLRCVPTDEDGWFMLL